MVSLVEGHIHVTASKCPHNGAALCTGYWVQTDIEDLHKAFGKNSACGDSNLLPRASSAKEDGRFGAVGKGQEMPLRHVVPRASYDASTLLGDLQTEEVALRRTICRKAIGLEHRLRNLRVHWSTSQTIEASSSSFPSTCLCHAVTREWIRLTSYPTPSGSQKHPHDCELPSHCW